MNPEINNISKFVYSLLSATLSERKNPSCVCTACAHRPDGRGSRKTERTPQRESTTPTHAHRADGCNLQNFAPKLTLTLDPAGDIFLFPFLNCMVDEILADPESEADIAILENFQTPEIGPRALNSSAVIGAIEEIPDFVIQQTFALDFVQYEGKISKLNFVKFDNSSVSDLVVEFNKWQYKRKISQKYLEYPLNGHCYYFGAWCEYDIFIVFHPVCPDDCECEIGRSPLQCEDDYCRDACECSKNCSSSWVPDDISEIIQKEIAERISKFPEVQRYKFTKEKYNSGETFRIPLVLFRDFDLNFDDYPHYFFERHHFKFVINKFGQNVPERHTIYESELKRFDLTKVKSFKFAFAGDTKVESPQTPNVGVAAVFREDMLHSLFDYPEHFGNDYPGINYFPKSFQQNFGSIQSDAVFPPRMLDLETSVNDQSLFFDLKLLSNQLYNQTSRVLRRNENVEIWRNLPISKIFAERLFSKRIKIFEEISKMNGNLQRNLLEIYNSGVGPRYEAVFNLNLKQSDQDDEVEAREHDFILVLTQISNAFKTLCTNEIRQGIAWVRDRVFPTILMGWNDIIWRSIKQPIQRFCKESHYKLTLGQIELFLMMERLLLVNINGNYRRFLSGPCVYFRIKSNVEEYSYPYFPNEYFDYGNFSINLGM